MCRTQVRGRLNSASRTGFYDCERDLSGAGYVIQERSSQIKLTPVDLHSNLKHQAKHHIVYFPGVTSNVSNFASGAGRASISIYSGSGEESNSRYHWNTGQMRF